MENNFLNDKNLKNLLKKNNLHFGHLLIYLIKPILSVQVCSPYKS